MVPARLKVCLRRVSFGFNFVFPPKEGPLTPSRQLVKCNKIPSDKIMRYISWLTMGCQKVRPAVSSRLTGSNVRLVKPGNEIPGYRRLSGDTFVPLNYRMRCVQHTLAEVVCLR